MPHPTAKNTDLAEADRLRTEACAHFLATYRALQKETQQAVPPRKALNLRSIPSVAPYLAIFEVKEGNRFIVRLVGTGFVLRTGIDNTGHDALEILPPELREWTRSHFLKIAGTPCGSLCIAREAYGDARMLTEVLSLPFTGASGKVNLILSASIPFERPDYRGIDDGMSIGGFSEVVYFDIGAGMPHQSNWR